MKKKIVIAGVVLLILALSYGGYYYFTSNNYVAMVSDIEATKGEYVFLLNLVKGKMEENTGLDNESARNAFWDSSSLSGKKKIEEAKKKSLEELKLLKIQYIKAQEVGTALTKSELDDAYKVLDENIKKEAGTGDAELFSKSKYGISIEEFKTIFKDISLISKFVEEKKSQMVLTDEELENYYNDNKDTLNKVTITQILLSTVEKNTQKDMNEEKKEEVRLKAWDILKRIKSGEDMKLLVLEFSQDPLVSSNEGKRDIDYYSDDEENLKAWSLKHLKGDADVVETGFGYHVVRVENWTTFKDIKDYVKVVLLGEKYLDLVDEWTKESEYNIIPNESVLNSIKFPK